MVATDRPMGDPLVVLREEFDDWAVLFHPDTGQALGLNPTGVAIWKRLDGRHTLADIAAELDQDFEAVSPDAGQDVSAFVDELVVRGFVGLMA